MLAAMDPNLFHLDWERTGDSTTILFDETFFGNDDDAASLACSDHRPVWISLAVPGADDD